MSNYHIKHLEEYWQVYRKSVRNPEDFLGRNCRRTFFMEKKSGTRCWSGDFSKPEVKWYKGAKLNITENCIDRHLYNTSR